MDPSEPLLQIAEIALGLAGFAGIFVALGGVGRRVRDVADTYRLVMLISSALSTLVLALLPVGLLAAGLPDAAVWRTSSALLAALMSGVAVYVVRQTRRHFAEIRAGELRGASRVIWVLTVAMFAAQLANVVGFFERSYAAFLLGLIFLVAYSGYLFARMLFLWRG